MALTAVDSTVAANVAAATTQEDQRDAVIAPFASDDVTVRFYAGGTLAETGTFGPVVPNASTPRGWTLGALQASTVHVSDATITHAIYRTAGGTDILQAAAADLGLTSPTTKTGRRTNLADAVRPKVTHTAMASLPTGASPPTTATLSMSSTATTDVALAGTITLDETADQDYTASLSISDSGTLSTAAPVMLDGTTSIGFTATWDAAGSGRTVTLNSMTPTLTVAGSPATVTVGDAPAAPTSFYGAYRTNRQQLFADIIASTPTTGSDVSQFSALARTAIAAPKADYQLGVMGPTAYYVEIAAKWSWLNTGGDWINTAGTPQGTTLPHCTFTANAVTSGSAEYTANILPAVQAALARGKWLALIFMATGAGFRRVISRHHATLPAPVLEVTYLDGSVGTLACVACVRLTTGTSTSLIGSDVATLGTVAIEFEMPTKLVTAATLRINLTDHTTSTCTVNGYLANPPVSTAPVTTGVAASYPTDEGITAHASVLFAQRYTDGSVKSDFIIPGSVNPNVFEKSAWDASLWGGATELTKLPTAALGTPVAGTNKWLYKNLWDTPNISIVPSTHTADNFEPVAEGIGAMRIVIPAATAADGGNVGYSGGSGSDLWMLFPKDISGLVDEVFVRFKLRIASQPQLLADTKMFRNETGATATYGVGAGKFGIGAHMWTPFGGNDNSGGGSLGWSARMKYTEHPADVTGMMGYTLGVHSYDQLGYDFYFGKEGLGAGFEPDRWYDIEVRLKLNTWLNDAGTSPADGECEVWIDGKRDSLHTGWKFRDGPLDAARTASASFSPFREMGAIGLCLNSYNGGVKPPDQDLVFFYANVVASTERIGPMQPPAVPVPGWAASLVSGQWVMLP